MPFVPDIIEAPPKRSGFVPDAPPAPGQLTDPSQVQPSAEERLRQKEAVGVRTAYRQQREKFTNENAEKGVPLDIDAELPAMQRARVSLDSNIDKQADLLSKQPGVLGARKSKDGRNVIVRVEEDGKTKDVLLHPLTSAVSLGDVAGAAGPIGKAAGAVGLALATSGASLPLTAAAMGGGAALMEAASSGGSRLAAGQSIDPGELAKSSAVEGGINAALPLAGAAVTGTLRGARNLLSRNPSALAQDVAGASQRTGVPVFPSQTTDSKILARGEEFAGLKKLKDTQQGAMRTAFDREVGPSGGAGVLSESDIARRTQPVFAADAEAAERGARITMTDAEREAQRQLQDQLDRGLVPAGASNTAVGQHTRTKFEEFVANTQKQAAIDYAAFHGKAAEEGIELSKKPITDLVAKIEKEDPAGVVEFLAPSVRQVKTVESKLTKPLAEAEPAQYAGFQQITPGTPAVPAPPLTFEEAIRQRSIVRQKLNAPDDPLGDVVKSYYKQLERAYTDAIDEGLSRGTPELQALYEKARSGYRGAAEVLDKGVVQKLFREPGEAGRVADENVVKQLFAGDGKLEALRDMRQILGADSADYKLLIRQGVQNMMDDAAAKGSGGLIDVNSFLTRFNNLSKEMRAEMFGALEPSLKATADAFAIAQGGAAKAAKIPADELADALLSSPRDARRLIEQAVQRQNAYESEYTRGIMTKLTGRNLDVKDLGNLDRFVSDFVPDASAADMRQILTRIEAAQPGSADQLRARVMANIRRDVTAKEPLEKTAGEVFDLNPDKITPYISGPEAEKYRAIIGQRGMQFLEDMQTIAKSNAVRVERGSHEHVTPRILGKEALSGAAGFFRNAISTGVDLATILPRAITGNAERFAAVREFLTTGQFPALGIKSKVARGLALAAPETIEARQEVLAEKP